MEYTTQAIHRLATYADNRYYPDQGRITTDAQRLTLLFLDATSMFCLFVALPVSLVGLTVGIAVTGHVWSWAALSAASLWIAHYSRPHRFVEQIALWQPNYRDWRGETLVHLADSVERVRQLARAGADFNATNAHGETPLASAIEKELSAAMIEALIEGGADLRAENFLYRCIRRESALAIFDCFFRLGEDPNAQVHGKPLLYWALLHGLPRDVIRRFMEGGANPDVMVGPFSILEHAARWNTPQDVLHAIWGDLVEIPAPRAYLSDRAVFDALSEEARRDLLDHEVFFDRDQTPLLHYAISEGCSDATVIEIIRKGSDVNRTISRYLTPLTDILIHRPSLPVIEALGEAGVDFNQTFRMRDGTAPAPASAMLGRSPLYQAVDSGVEEHLIRYLVDHGARITPAEDVHGNLLLIAVSHDYSPECLEDIVMPQSTGGMCCSVYHSIRSRRVAQFLHRKHPLPFQLIANKRNCFMSALELGASPDLIDWFLENCEVTENGSTICHHITTREQFTHLYERLGQNSPLWTTRDRNGCLPIHRISRLGALQALVESNLNSIHARDSHGRTPLIHRLHSPEIVQFFLKQGSNVDGDILFRAWSNGMSSIGQIKIIQDLLFYGADARHIKGEIEELDRWWKALSDEVREEILSLAKEAKEGNRDVVPPDIAKVMLLEIFAYFSLLPGQQIKPRSRRRAVAMAKWYAEQEREDA